MAIAVARTSNIAVCSAPLSNRHTATGGARTVFEYSATAAWSTEDFPVPGSPVTSTTGPVRVTTCHTSGRMPLIIAARHACPPFTANASTDLPTRHTIGATRSAPWPQHASFRSLLAREKCGRATHLIFAVVVFPLPFICSFSNPGVTSRPPDSRLTGSRPTRCHREALLKCVTFFQNAATRPFDGCKRLVVTHRRSG